MENESLLDVVTKKAHSWLSDSYDADTRSEVMRMLENEDKRELIDAFYKDMEFGTGGIRGIMGAGSNRVNIYTIGAATQGLANYLKMEFPHLEPIKVVIGHDSRNGSRKFAEITANIFSANGIKVYLFEDLRPTPEISFAIRKLGCQSGVMVTASHNPKEYNGYKVYWSDGAQVISPHDKNIIGEVNRIKSVKDIKFDGNTKLIETIGKDMDNAFIDEVKKMVICPEVIQKHHDLKIVYTPLHGTGIKLVPDTLKTIGFTNVICEPKQSIPDGNFPTVVSPNPEEEAALELSIKLAEETGADIVLGTDPDGDRIGTAVRDNNGHFVLITGNQALILYTYYILKQRSHLGLLSDNDFMVKTIVSTELAKKIADSYNVNMIDCYTGFKWIAALIRENEGKKHYIGGGEESYGFLAGDFVRDKDSVSACALYAEIAAWAKNQGKTIYNILEDIYLQYGYSKAVGVSIVHKGKEGAEEIEAMMKNYRTNPIKTLGNSPISMIKDYTVLECSDLVNNEHTTIEMPTTSNVLQYFTEDGTKLSVRPSGTEPKIKYYIEVKENVKSISDLDKAKEDADKKIALIKKELGI